MKLVCRGYKRFERTAAKLVASAASVVLAGSVVAIAATGESASAATASSRFSFAANGIVKFDAINGVGPVGPGTLSGDANPSTGAITSGRLQIPTVVVQAKLLGLLPVTITATVTQVGSLTGQLNPNGQDVTADLQANVHLVSVTGIGGIELVSGPCTTSTPSSIHFANSGPFSLVSGGTIVSNFLVGQFSDCGLLTGALNLVETGGNHSITLKLTA